MLTIYGTQQRFCDGISRRNFLKIGALGLGGLTLPQLLQAEAQSGIRRSHKAVIMIFLPGGPSHQDIFDLKMDAPAEIRGEFRPIATSIPGIQICEHLPRLAKMMTSSRLFAPLSALPATIMPCNASPGVPIKICHPAAGRLSARRLPNCKVR